MSWWWIVLPVWLVGSVPFSMFLGFCVRAGQQTETSAAEVLGRASTSVADRSAEVVPATRFADQSSLVVTPEIPVDRDHREAGEARLADALV
jgi:hypothetical protein